ncbi:MAG: DUF4398 domain-containing protein, partial [candidate division NC10 bacterium]|nr:DUF4398 domain-containing protein [candidate division NC10 bacterium]
MSKQFASTIVLLFVLALLLAFMNFGCAVAPTKEIEDAKSAIDAAKAADASKYAPGELKSAESALAEAISLMEKKEYDDARRLAISAKGHATSAKEKAEAEAASAKAKATAAIAKADEAAEKAESEGAKIFADPEFSSARDILTQAKAAFQAGNFEEAKDIAVLAEKQFLAAAETAKKQAEAKIAADRAIAEAEEAAKEAEAAGPKALAESEFASAQELLEEAKASYMDKKYQEAKEQATSAKEAFVLALDAASRRAADIQEKERLEALRSEAEAAISSAERAAAEADAAGAEIHAAELYQAAQGQLNSAKDAFSSQQYEEAKKLGLLAQSSFLDAAKAAPLLAAEAAAREEAARIREGAARQEEDLRSEVAAARSEAESAKAEAAAARSEAEAAQAEAEQAKAAYAAAQ